MAIEMLRFQTRNVEPRPTNNGQCDPNVQNDFNGSHAEMTVSYRLSKNHCVFVCCLSK